LQDATGDHQVKIARDAAQQRAQREKADSTGENRTSAEAVCHPAAERNEDGQAEGVAREHGLHAERRDVQRLRHGRERRI
jgi:hypothetical protein